MTKVADLAGLTMALGDAAIVAGSTTTMTAGAVIDYCINGKAHTAPAISAVQPATTDANTGVAIKGISPGYGAVIVFGYNAAESTAMQMVESEHCKLAANASAYHPGAFLDVPELPKIPDDFCPVGYVVIKVATDYTAGSTYVFGTSNTTATGAQNSAATAHANTFVSIAALPNRPQAS